MRRMRRPGTRSALALALVAPLGLLGAGCRTAPGGVGSGCSTGGDCAPGLACIDPMELPGGYCSRPCDAATACPDGSVCYDPSATGEGFCFAACASAADCRTGDGYVCSHDSVCDRPCTADLECPAGFFCAKDGVCTDEADRPPPDPGETGAPCGSAGDAPCDPGLACLPPALGGRCSVACTSELQCDNGTTCAALAVDDGTGAAALETWCVFSAGTAPFGAACGGLAAGAACAGGVCWNGVCTELCATPGATAPGECGGGAIDCRLADVAVGDAAGPLALCDVPFPLPPLLDLVDFGQVGDGDVLTFDLPADAVSFTITLDGLATDYYAAIWVEAPDGHYYIDDIPGWFDGDDDPVRVDPVTRYFAVTVPSTDRPGAALAGPGTYSFTVAGASADARVWIKRGPPPTRVDLNIYIVAGDQVGTTPLDAATARDDVFFVGLLAELSRWYAELGIAIGVVNWFDVADASLSDVESDAELGALFASSRTDVPPASLNVFFVNSLPGPEGTGGIAAGIPGALLAHGTTLSGVAIVLVPAAQILGMALFHELGHFVGLWHAKEAFGGEDPLLDTPSCPTANPPDTEPCASTTGRNFMYWSLVLPLWDPAEGPPNCAICPSQRSLILGSPVTW